MDQFKYDSILAKFARDCALHKYFKSCNGQCATCASNVAVYLEDKKQAVMIQHHADLVLQSDPPVIKKKRKPVSDWGVFWLFVLGVIIVVCGMFAFANYADNKLHESYLQSRESDKQRRAARIAEQRAKLTPAATADPLEPIRVTLRKVKSIDVNGDGDSDCVDYTLQFYDNYTPRGELRIMWNYNPAQDFNHLFVTVRGMGIEAGAYVNPTQGTKWFGIEKYWGSQYDPHYNKDVTAYVDSIRKGVFTWSR